ncbi:substrate-binding domain-containing protein [Streptomyces sp. NPDC006365]|uniref:substrate-binding domain-containing protein n=1 Tax=Streptomyces sp. NPDC006365 TaxID=3364744 RepID=UPI0036A7E047
MGEQSPAGGAAAFEALYAARPDLTAVVAFHDLVAIGALRAARRLGVQVPDDCAPVGYDGLSVVELVGPPLTTLHLDKRRLGELAIHQVDQLTRGSQCLRPLREHGHRQSLVSLVGGTLFASGARSTINPHEARGQL